MTFCGKFFSIKIYFFDEILSILANILSFISWNMSFWSGVLKPWNEEGLVFVHIDRDYIADIRLLVSHIYL